MMRPSLIQPDAELRDFLQGRVSVKVSSTRTEPVVVYRDWERPTNKLPDDFIVVYMNGEPEGLGTDIEFAKGYIMVGLYCKMNDDGSVKVNRVRKILEKFDELLIGLTTENYHFDYDMPRFITPTSPNQSSGYSITVLNLRWTTTINFAKTE